MVIFEAHTVRFPSMGTKEKWVLDFHNFALFTASTDYETGLLHALTYSYVGTVR